MMDMKRCTKCGGTKPLTEFGNRLGGKDGLRAQCRECRNAINKVWLDKRKAIDALRHKEVHDIPEPRRKCPRCKESRHWNEYPDVTTRNEGMDFMCNECREKAEKVRKAKVHKIRAKITRKRLAINYRAKMKRDAESWRAHIKSTGRIWYGTTAEDAKQWREHGKKEVLALAEKKVQTQAELNTFLKKEKDGAALLRDKEARFQVEEEEDHADLFQAVEERLRTSRLQAEIDSWPKLDIVTT